MKAQKIGESLKTVTKLSLYKEKTRKMPELTAVIETRGNIAGIKNPSQWKKGDSKTHCEQNSRPQAVNLTQNAVAIQKIKLTKKAEPTVETISELIQAGNKQQSSDIAGKTPLQTDDAGLAEAVADATDAAENPPAVLVDESLEMRAA
ncbi:uncharacterized protein TEOVI_000453900 [Trypanosoma equiperdum]|uniref:Uncharacterized protein n=1 Tax=Trypanosoma equiperdum TaxID=5694 RepID=A0A1G4IKA3_TRYEQ|nr:hypothetical protein TEOVI_000453900 [Trypanosoma equiperdum]